MISDFILQSIGIIGFLLSLNILIWGIKIIISKDSNNILKKIFFSLVYILSGTATINIYKDHSFWLLDNGNGGFVGRVVSDFIFKYINFLENNYITLSLSLITLVFFLASINLKINHIAKFFKLIGFIFGKFFLIFKSEKKIEV